MNSEWHIKYGSWWMVQWCLDGWFSLGFHIDLKSRKDNLDRKYGPYIDLHLGFIIISFGVNPAYSGELESVLGVSRGGIPCPH